MFTRRTILCLIGGMVIYQIVSGLPRSFGVRLSWTTSPLSGRAKLAYWIFRPRLVVYSFLASFSIPNIVCFIVVVIGTIFLISKFKQSRKFRDSVSASGGQELGKLSNKDLRLVRSMIFISVIYIAGATPGVLVYVFTTAYTSLHIDDPYYGTLATLLFLTSSIVQALASSVNIFVYVSMGSKFKRTLKEVLFLKSESL
ncbi:chemosensory receptor A [Elysia marginata]|uniref:Chemosensory receptor A n=1 Tax=Elysia marginata TaxID=1093978 RepID=A0AAV4JJK4_9GAST|nr:chemosensory receptor A [Elysia marginata]